MTDTIVIGGGPAGLLASIKAAEKGEKVLLVEKNDYPGKKLLLTGKGRCNITSTLRPEEVIEKVFQNPNFLYSALFSFPPAETQKFFRNRGLKLKEERGRRIYPESDDASDVKKILVNTAKKLGVNICTGVEIKKILGEDKCRGVKTTEENVFRSDRVILAAGGFTYPSTGSDGSGFELSIDVGHSLKPFPEPSLVPLKIKEDWLQKTAGLILKNIKLSMISKEEKLFEDIGKLELRENEIGGPLALAASCHYSNRKKAQPFKIYLDLKPGLNFVKLEERLQSDFAKYSNKNYKNVFQDLLPAWIRPVIVDLSKIAPDKKVHQISATERKRICHLLKNLKLTVVDNAGVEKAIITRGGVNTEEIDPSTMESKIFSRLYFAGEVLAPAAYTGGHNLQIAFSTGYLAGVSG